MQKANPDIIILKGKYPKVDKNIELNGPVEAVIVASDVSSVFRFKPDLSRFHPETIYYVRSSGAFRAKLNKR